jgi:biopolymer transport protein ExbD
MRANWVAVAVMLTLALVIFVSSTRRLPTAGFMIDIATAPEHCGDGRETVASAAGNDRVTLNSDPSLDIREFLPGLRETLKHRAEKLVYVRAEPGVSFGEFVQLVDAVRPEAGIVSLITPQVGVLARARYCLAPSCGLCRDPRSSRLKRSVN